MGMSQEACYPDDEIARTHLKIVRACLHAGLQRQDAEDVAQDVWEWVLRSGSTRALETHWMNGVVQNFLLRYWKQRKRAKQVMGFYLSDQTYWLRDDPLRPIESKITLDRIERELPSIEHKLLQLLRLGYSFASAATALKIPHGSHAYFRRRLAMHVRHRAEWPRAPAGLTGFEESKQSACPRALS